MWRIWAYSPKLYNGKAGGQKQEGYMRTRGRKNGGVKRE